MPPILQKFLSRDTNVLILLGLGVVLLHTLVNGQYGFHRDELLSLDNARNFAWGYVVYPPMTPVLGRMELGLFGDSLRGFRFFPAVAQALVVLLTGLAAREFGGKRWAQIVAALAVVVGGHSMFSGSFMSYSSFDYLWWALVAYFVLRLLKSEDPRWWIAIGSAIGVGMLTKYTMGALALGVAGGVFLTPPRRYLKSPWLWTGVAVTLALMLPNIVWQMNHNFVSLDFVKSIHARDVRNGSTDYFLLNQFWKSTNPVTVPLWCAGLWRVLAAPEGKRYRLLGWIYVIPMLVFLVARGRDYYLAGAYPILFAAGAAWAERWADSLGTRSGMIIRGTAWRTLAVAGICTAAVTIPIAPVNSMWWHVADHITGGNFNSQIGWPDMVETVAKIRDSLPFQERPRLGILAGDDGETGAINLYGPAYGLPRAISGMNSNWLRGYGDPPPETVIAVGMDLNFINQTFENCALAGRISNRYGIQNDVVGAYANVYVCRRLRQTWPAFWEHFQYYG